MVFVPVLFQTSTATPLSLFGPEVLPGWGRPSPPGSCTAEIRGMHLIWNNKDPPSSTGGRSHPGGRDEQGGPMALLV